MEQMTEYLSFPVLDYNEIENLSQTFRFEAEVSVASLNCPSH